MVSTELGQITQVPPPSISSRPTLSYSPSGAISGTSFSSTGDLIRSTGTVISRLPTGASGSNVPYVTSSSNGSWTFSRKGMTLAPTLPHSIFTSSHQQTSPFDSLFSTSRTSTHHQTSTLLVPSSSRITSSQTTSLPSNHPSSSLFTGQASRSAKSLIISMICALV